MKKLQHKRIVIHVIFKKLLRYLIILKIFIKLFSIIFIWLDM